MKCLSLQVEPSLDESVDPEVLMAALKKLGRFPEVDREKLEGKSYVIFNIFSDDVAALWKELQQSLFEDESLATWLKRTTIVACEGENGWDDGLLLAHHDASETLDDLELASNSPSEAS
ncbi:MAG: hypothetical protein ACI93R_002520 [Flavobacteriales bacterium]|jgi:hypothetical protein